MAQPVPPLSEMQLSQLLSQIREINTFNGETNMLEPFIRRIDFLVQLYPTQDDRQRNVVFSAIENQLGIQARQTMRRYLAGDWLTLRAALISKYNNHTPMEELIRRLYNTQYRGSLRKFCEDLEEKSNV
ncbi:hypothetical protein KR067_004074, partial [Drosophila pandora]